MIRLLYFSQAAPTTTGRDIKEILISARRNNRKMDITGVLVTGGRVFLQILEGPEQSVLSLYLTILQDKRHAEVELMRVARIKERVFDDWSMAFVESTPLEFQQIMEFKSAFFALGEPQDFMTAMHGLMNVLSGQKKSIGASS